MATSHYGAKYFDLELKDNEAKTFFRDKDSGVDFALGVVLLTTLGKRQGRIKFILSFATKKNDNFDSIEGVEAETIYNKHFRWLSVRDKVRIANLEYTFYFGCGKTKKRQLEK